MDPLLDKLTAHERTMSLNGWGSIIYALTLPFFKWRPGRAHLAGPLAWLIRRAAAAEGGTGTAAMIRWQNHCQARWLAMVRPSLIAWPWENHSWERVFVRRAKGFGIDTVGYQHSMLGRHMLNYAPFSNPDFLDSIPDRILCIGAPYSAQLAKWSVPDERLAIAGAFRFSDAAMCKFDASAPVFAALPFAGSVGDEMLEAITEASETGLRFLVKPHPMLPMQFTETAGLKQTSEPLTKQSAVSAVIYCASAVGLEAYFAGIPTLRFLADQVVAIDILPENVSVPVAGRGGISGAISTLQRPEPVPREEVFADVDYGVWADIFGK
jgi:surface carbohydrate biosynthesis protein (TIGR04326 family)